MEVGGKGLLFGLGQCYKVAQLVEAIYDMFQCVWHVQFKVLLLFIIRGTIVGVGPGKMLGIVSFPGAFGCCIRVTKCHHSGLW